jgi:hypothetical protein
MGQGVAQRCGPDLTYRTKHTAISTGITASTLDRSGPRPPASQREQAGPVDRLQRVGRQEPDQVQSADPPAIRGAAWTTFRDAVGLPTMHAVEFEAEGNREDVPAAGRRYGHIDCSKGTRTEFPN